MQHAPGSGSCPVSLVLKANTPLAKGTHHTLKLFLQLGPSWASQNSPGFSSQEELTFLNKQVNGRSTNSVQTNIAGPDSL